MTTHTIDGKEYEVKHRYRIGDRETMVIVEVPKKPAPLLPWVLVDKQDGTVEFSADTKPLIERVWDDYQTPGDFRIARIVEVPENARRVWVVMNGQGNSCGTYGGRHRAERLLKLMSDGRHPPYTLHEFIEIGEVKV